MACTFRLTTVAATAAKHLLTAHRSNVRNGVSAGGALVLRRLSDRPFRVRRRPLQGALLPRVAQRKLHRTHFFLRRYMGAGLVRRIVRLLYAANYANAEP